MVRLVRVPIEQNSVVSSLIWGWSLVRRFAVASSPARALCRARRTALFNISREEDAHFAACHINEGGMDEATVGRSNRDRRAIK